MAPLGLCHGPNGTIAVMFPTSRREDDGRPSVRPPRRMAAVLALALVPLLLGATTTATAQAPSSPTRLSPIAFRAIDPSAITGRTTTAPQPPASIHEPLAATSDITLSGVLSPAQAEATLSRPDAAQPEPSVRTQSKAPPGRIRARGAATWYCVAGVSACHRDYGGGLYAAAGAELRVGDWRGRKVTVCAAGGCVRVTLVDWCACPGDRIIDLYGDAFRRLAPLGTGILRVSVRW